jgi:hypothetical protein
MKRAFRILGFVVMGTVLACDIAATLSALSNRGLPAALEASGRLDPLDKARLAEALHLKRTLGEEVWAGWGKSEIPVLLWNRESAFLVGYPSPPTPWEEVPGDSFQGQAYFRRPTGETQNFALRVGDRWVASIATKWEADAFLIDMFRDMLPSPFEPIFPYRVLIQPSEVQITAVLHESFHVHQAQVAPARLAEAEAAHSKEDRYWQEDQAMGEDWGREIDLLAKALEARSSEEAAALARRFLAGREERRQRHALDAALIDYERQLEWEEGLAKYVELAIWRQAAQAEGYEPETALADDPDFRGYATFGRRWSQEMGQMKRQAGREGEVRFYYTGMAQAMLLDRLLPGWEERALSEDIWLEGLLAEAAEHG